tara:strand:- start:797 stop:985 length:189 start_codon:yes stop_codon:yes gene_type:complete
MTDSSMDVSSRFGASFRLNIGVGTQFNEVDPQAIKVTELTGEIEDLITQGNTGSHLKPGFTL